MAEGILKSLDSRLQVFSAGTAPAAIVHPKAIQVMSELGIDLKGARPKHVDQFLNESLDYVITVCDHANETCPVFTGSVRNRLHIGFEDPASASGSDEYILSVFRKVRDEIRIKFHNLYQQQILQEVSMSTKSWGFIGAGRVTRILLEGFKRANRLPERIVVYDINPEVTINLQKQYPGISMADTAAGAAKQDYVFLALHPPAMNAGMEAVRNDLNKDAIVISLAPKFTIEKLTSGLAGFTRVVRWLPNAATYIGHGHNPCAFSLSLSPAEQAELSSLFSSVGDCVRVAEEKIEAYAIIIAMGPTYFWFQWQKLFELGEAFGLSDQELKAGIPAMLNGAIQTYFASGLTPDQVMDLIPVKPLVEDEPTITAVLRDKLIALYKKLKG